VKRPFETAEMFKGNKNTKTLSSVTRKNKKMFLLKVIREQWEWPNPLLYVKVALKRHPVVLLIEIMDRNGALIN
jgi:hypothetical protein